jgi:hypothetical protein
MTLASCAVEDDTLKLGLLLEAAHAQQTLATTTLERLREHAAGLDVIVREEIRHTFLEEMQALAADSQRAAEALRRLQRAASARVTVWSVGVLALATAVPLGITWYVLPTRADVAALGTRRDELTVNIARLAREGGNVELRRCGAAQRLCVRVDRSAPRYGEGGDFLVVKGY